MNKLNDSNVRIVFMVGYLTQKATEINNKSLRDLIPYPPNNKYYPSNSGELKKWVCELLPLIGGYGEEYAEVEPIVSELSQSLITNDNLITTSHLHNMGYYFTLGMTCSDETYTKCMEGNL